VSLADVSPAADELWKLLVLGVVQGVSEFLPISSDGHLVLAQEALAFRGARLPVDVALHLGTLAVVLVAFRRDLAVLARDALAGRFTELRLLALGTLPAAAIGLGLRAYVAALFESGLAAALGLLATAVLLFLGERARTGAAPPGRALDWRAALWIGCAQAAAILPGVSRSGSTISLALLLGVESRAAARFSFLLSIPAVAGAVVLEVPALVREGGFGLDLLAAVAVTFVVGLGALRLLLTFLGRGAFRWCALYCALLGGGALAWFGTRG
jgi:undecaprenyl-diphosphatase